MKITIPRIFNKAKEARQLANEFDLTKEELCEAAKAVNDRRGKVANYTGSVAFGCFMVTAFSFVKPYELTLAIIGFPALVHLMTSGEFIKSTTANIDLVKENGNDEGLRGEFSVVQKAILLKGAVVPRRTISLFAKHALPENKK